MFLNRVQKQMLDQEVQDKINAVGNKSDLKTTNKNSVVEAVNEVTTQVADTVTDLSDVLSFKKLSKEGISTETTDATTSLNAAFANLKSQGIKYAYIDEPIKLNALSPLTQSTDMILYGNAEFDNIHQDNYFKRVAKRLSQFSGTINTYKAPFTQFRAALTRGDNIKFAIWGDSISNNGDRLGVNSVTDTGTEKGFDILTSGDGYTSRLMQQISDAFPTKVFDFYNRAIGGETLNNWNGLKTFNAVEKTWIEHIKDTNPDVLFIAFGMNHYTVGTAKTFSYKMKQVIDYINANFVKKPDIVFVTTPLAAYTPSLTSYGTFEAQSSRQMTADVIRNNAYKYGYYVMDVNKISNIKRFGTHFRNAEFKQLDLTGKVVSTVAPSNGTYSMTAVNDLVTINHYTKDFTLEFNLAFTNVTGSSGESLVIYTNKMPGISGINENQIQFLPNLNSTSKIRTYTKIANYTEWGDVYQQKNYTTVETYYNKVRIAKRGSRLEVYVNGDLMVRDTVDTWDNAGFIRFQKSGGSNVGIAITELELIAEDFETYLPSMTDEDMYGKFVSGDYTRKAPYGGNGINHPSTIGVERTYVPAIQELIADMKLISFL